MNRITQTLIDNILEPDADGVPPIEYMMERLAKSSASTRAAVIEWLSRECFDMTNDHNAPAYWREMALAALDLVEWHEVAECFEDVDEQMEATNNDR